MTVENLPEMGRYVRQIVDNSFEEGQFESGVAMLDLLRSPDHKPSIIHILHLIFIALQPVQETQLNEEEKEIDRKTLLLQSPRKMIKHSKASLILSASTVIAAQQLLMSLIVTNPPQAIVIALPCFPETKNEPLMEFPFSESMIFDQAVAIKYSKNCWEILKSSFKARTKHFLNTPKAKGKQSSRIRFAEPSFADLDEENIKVVADDSWFLLEWLVMLFEKDADATEKQSHERYSPFLLKQLPPPPIGSSARWDASEPLRVVFYAFQQFDIRRQRSGIRLLILLIELTQTPHLNLSSFASSVLAQLNTVNPTASSQFTTLFNHLSTTPAALSFKLALCKKIIEDASDVSLSSPSGPSFLIGGTTECVNSRRGASSMRQSVTSKKPRAQPRARVKTHMAESSVMSLDGNTTESITTSPILSRTPLNIPAAPESINDNTNANTNPPPAVSPTYVARLLSHAEFVQLLKTTFPFFTFSCSQQRRTSQLGRHLPNKPWATHSLLTRVKFELSLAYVLVQVHRREIAEQRGLLPKKKSGAQRLANLDSLDAAFAKSVDDGSFAALVDEIFAPEGGNEDEERVLFKDVLKGVAGLPLAEDAEGEIAIA